MGVSMGVGVYFGICMCVSVWLTYTCVADMSQLIDDDDCLTVEWMPVRSNNY